MVQTASGNSGHSGAKGNLILLSVLENIEVEISVELGAATMPIHHLLRMGRGAVIELDATENEPLSIYANKTLIALGEVKIEDGQLLIEVTSKSLKPA
jgi:flagellar motor switch protein FliN